MSDDDLVAAHDAIAGLSGSYSTADDYRAELARREVNRQTSVMLRLTWSIIVLTLANAGLVAYSGPELGRALPSPYATAAVERTRRVTCWDEGRRWEERAASFVGAWMQMTASASWIGGPLRRIG